MVNVAGLLKVHGVTPCAFHGNKKPALSGTGFD
ncbi:hypothetical protein JOC76_001898 [Neobacillus cucumis]|nr:hypothetical protein [Neobacillus cucumis]